VGKELQDKTRDEELPFERSSFRIGGKIGTKKAKAFIFLVFCSVAKDRVLVKIQAGQRTLAGHFFGETIEKPAVAGPQFNYTVVETWVEGPDEADEFFSGRAEFIAVCVDCFKGTIPVSAGISSPNIFHEEAAPFRLGERVVKVSGEIGSDESVDVESDKNEEDCGRKEDKP